MSSLLASSRGLLVLELLERQRLLGLAHRLGPRLVLSDCCVNLGTHLPLLLLHPGAGGISGGRRDRLDGAVGPLCRHCLAAGPRRRLCARTVAWRLRLRSKLGQVLQLMADALRHPDLGRSGCLGKRTCVLAVRLDLHLVRGRLEADGRLLRAQRAGCLRLCNGLRRLGGDAR